jgi:hypothetical protein
MIISEFLAWRAALVAGLAAGMFGLCIGPAKAIEAWRSTRLAQNGEASQARPPEPPIRVKTVDYQDAGEQAGKLKLSGTAAPGSALYLYFDDAPLAKVVADGDGQWSLEREVELAAGHHTLRAEQYDPTTRMLAGRATVGIERAAPGVAKGQDKPADGPAPPATEP